ncbi:MAG: hypothetical protein QW112_00930, partial [Candidatus Micrarchaeia archaeon]
MVYIMKNSGYRRNNKSKLLNCKYNGNAIKIFHPSDETIFKAAQDEIGRYMELKLKERIFGKKLHFSPLFISHSIKFTNNLEINITDGKIIGDKINRGAKVR